MNIAINSAFEDGIFQLSKLKSSVIIVSAVLVQIGFMYLISMIIFPSSPGGFKYRSLTEHFVTAVIVAPLLETYVFQKGIITFGIRTIRTTKLIAVLLSATAFSLIHIYSVAYIIVTFFIGILYGIIYLSFLAKNRDAFWYMAIIHAAYNLYAFIMNSFILNNN